MTDIQIHIDDIPTHLVSDAIWELLRLIAEGVILWIWNRSRKAQIGVSKSRITWSLVAVSVLAILFWLGLRIYRHGGFLNGVLFTTNCVIQLILVSVIVYPFIRNFLPYGKKKLDWEKHYPKGEGYKWVTYLDSPQHSAVIGQSSWGLSFRTQSDHRGQRWANMQVEFDTAQDFRGWTGISFDLRCGDLYPDTDVSMQISTSDDSRYLAKRVNLTRKQKVTFLFQEMQWGDWSTPSPKGYLDLQQVQRVAVVCYTTCTDVKFSVSNFTLVKTVDD